MGFLDGITLISENEDASKDKIKSFTADEKFLFTTRGNDRVPIWDQVNWKFIQNLNSLELLIIQGIRMALTDAHQHLPVIQYRWEILGFQQLKICVISICDQKEINAI